MSKRYSPIKKRIPLRRKTTSIKIPRGKRIFELKKINKEVKDEWMESWIDEVLKDGEKQIRLELHDLWKIMNTQSKLLDRVTNGRMSKPGYTWEAIEQVLDEIEEEKGE